MIKRNRENNYWEEMEVYDKWHEGSNEQTYAEYGPQEDFEGDNGEDNIDY